MESAWDPEYQWAGAHSWGREQQRAVYRRPLDSWVRRKLGNPSGGGSGEGQMLAQHCLTEQVKGPDKTSLVYSSKIPARKLVKRVKSTARMEWGPR